jgi:putative FmdB family regulatory protein
MPLYEYRCDSCGHQFEVIQKFSDDPIALCPSCGAGPVVKLLSSPAIQFKGNGWYVTDYARKDSKPKDSKDEKAPAASTPATDTASSGSSTGTTPPASSPSKTD